MLRSRPPRHGGRVRGACAGSEGPFGTCIFGPCHGRSDLNHVVLPVQNILQIILYLFRRLVAALISAGIDQRCVVVSGDSKRPRGRGGRAAGLLVLVMMAAQVSSPAVLGLVCLYNRYFDTSAYLSTCPHSRAGRARHSHRAPTPLRVFGVLPWPTRERRWARLRSACACAGESRSRNLQAWAT